MDNFQIGFLIIEGIFILATIEIIRKFYKKCLEIKHLQEKNREEIVFLVRVHGDELGDEIELIKNEVLDIRKDISIFEQNQINWITSLKHLPECGDEVLIHVDSEKKTEIGYLANGKQAWIIGRSNGSSEKISLEKVSKWKPMLKK